MLRKPRNGTPPRPDQAPRTCVIWKSFIYPFDLALKIPGTPASGHREAMKGQVESKEQVRSAVQLPRAVRRAPANFKQAGGLTPGTPGPPVEGRPASLLGPSTGCV